MSQSSARVDLETAPASDCGSPPEPALSFILGELQRNRITYCYWKSRARLDRVFNGDGDVDLLISRADQHCAAAILLDNDFKLFPSVSDKEHPAVLNFLGYDRVSGNLVHLHVHFRLVTGEKLFKNYRLPWEETLLARTVQLPDRPIRVLDPVSEALLLIVRGCLELSRADPLTLMNWRAKTGEYEDDRRRLAKTVDRNALRNLAVELLGSDLADPVADALFGGPPLERQHRLRKLIRRHAAIDRRYNAFEARLRSLARAVAWAGGQVNKRFLHSARPWNRRAPGSGSVVTLLGVDGSGKTTLVTAMRTWLGAKIDVLPIYMGTGDGKPSIYLWPFKIVLPFVTRMLKSRRTGISRGDRWADASRPLRPLHRILLMVWAVAVALDKRKKLLAARCGANRGLIVLTDRFPQDQIIGFNDSPLLGRVSGIPEWIRRLEAGIYARASRLQPDLVIKLTASPETIARREPTIDRAIIPGRMASLRRLAFPSARVVTVDADRPLTEVIAKVKHEIWQQL